MVLVLVLESPCLVEVIRGVPVDRMDAAIRVFLVDQKAVVTLGALLVDILVGLTVSGTTLCVVARMLGGYGHWERGIHWHCLVQEVPVRHFCI